MKLRNSIAFGVLAAAAAYALYTVAVGSSPAPAVVFTSLQGERIAMADMRGRVVIVNFWATDCAICVKEMPDMVRTYEHFRSHGMEFIAVAMRHDPPNYVIQYAEKNALPFKVALDPMGKIANAFGDVRLTPTTFVIDKRGNVVSRILGEPDFARLRALIERELAERV